MAKKRKGKKGRKKTDQKLHDMPAAQLVRSGEGWLADGNYRQAIQALKIACRKRPDDHKIQPLLFRAYLLREGQLRRKGLAKEADALHRQTLQYRPDPTRMDVEDLLICLGSTSLKNAVSMYGEYVAHHKPVPEAETVLAGALLTCSDWQAAGQLPDNSLLKPELPLLKEAVGLMNEARWEEALRCLQPVSRTSSLAAVRLLCRAMVCFYRNDDPGMERALAMMPDGYSLDGLIERLKSTPHDFAPLWQGVLISSEQIRLIIRAVKKEDYHSAGRQIKQLAGAIRPDDPGPVIEQVLFMLWPLVPTQELDAEDLAGMAERLLPGTPGRAMAAKFRFLEFADLLDDTADYLKWLGKEFPDPADCALAASMVLTDSVARIKNLGLETEAVALLSERSGKRLGIVSDYERSDLAMLEMTLKAQELDPRNPQVYDLLTQLPRNSREAKRLVNTGLTSMMDHLPDDPRPCIALADLYNSRNAFRKAEQFLCMAEQRAPHDEQVKERRVMALLKSVDINFNRDKRHLARPDLEKAARMAGKTTRAHVAVRSILLDMQQTGQMSLFDDEMLPEETGRVRDVIHSHIAGLEDADGLMTLAMLRGHSRQNPAMWDKTKRTGLKAVSRGQVDVLGTLASRQLRDLLLPDRGSLAIAGGMHAWLDDWLVQYKKILQGLGNEDLLPVLEALLEAGHIRPCLREIRRRCKIAKDPFRKLMRFYEMVVRCMNGGEPADAEAFTRLIEQISPQEREKFRSAARRLSKLVRGPLQTALEHFDFDLIDEPCSCPACTGRMDMDAFDYEDEDLPPPMDPRMDDSVRRIIDDLEELVDTVQMRGAPVKVLKKQRKLIRNEFQFREWIDGLAEMLPEEIVEDLSLEARILLYGKEAPFAG